MAKLCVFTGHRALPRDLTPLRCALRQEMARLAEEGYTDFASGGAMGFDLLAAELTLELRELMPAVRLLMILPCPHQEARYSPEDRLRYAEVLARADLVRYTSDRYYRGCMLTRDRTLAAAADVCVCWLLRSGSGTGYTVRQAALRDVPIINLAEQLGL